MNGIGFLVLIAVAGQLAAAQPMAQSQSRDYGWEVDRDGQTLCFIIQISPQKLTEMQNTGWELPSDMPEELVGRATRVTIRIGTALLPQIPSLEELRKLPRVNAPSDVTAQLGPGRISDVEPDKLLHVQQDRNAPALPSFGGAGVGASALPLDPQANLADQAQAVTNALSEKVKNFVPGTPNIHDVRSGIGLDPSRTNSAAVANGSSPVTPGFPGSFATPNKFNTPAVGNPVDNRNSTANNSINLQPPAYGRDQATQLTENRFATPTNPSGYGAGAAPQNNGYIPGAHVGGAYDQNDPNSLTSEMFNRIPPRQTPGGFGSFAGAGNQGAYAPNTGQLNNSYADPYANPNNNGFNNLNGPPYNANLAGEGVSRMTNSNVGNNPPSIISPVSSAATGITTHQNSLSDSTHEETTTTTKSKAADNILWVMFLLSLVVNFYLGMLIRKLLTRYRVLVANSRGQVTPNAYA